MRSDALALTLAGSFALLQSACSNDSHDYQVEVTWALNGMVPDAALCQELNIARARLEVRTSSGKLLKTLESNCAATIIRRDNGNTYGGFITTRAFDWDDDYSYALTMVDANGTAVSTTQQDAFYLPYEADDLYELPFLDYLNPTGTVAGLSAEWSVRATPDVAAACAADRITKVQVKIASGLDVDFEDGAAIATANCSDGQYVSNGKVLATGSYLFRYVALGEHDNVVEEGEPIALQVENQDVALPREMFLSN